MSAYSIATQPENTIARYPISLGLPAASPSLMADAAESGRNTAIPSDGSGCGAGSRVGGGHVGAR